MSLTGELLRFIRIIILANVFVDHNFNIFVAHTYSLYCKGTSMKQNNSYVIDMTYDTILTVLVTILAIICILDIISERSRRSLIHWGTQTTSTSHSLSAATPLQNWLKTNLISYSIKTNKVLKFRFKRFQSTTITKPSPPPRITARMDPTRTFLVNTL